MEKDMIEKLESCESLNLTEDNLMETLDALLFYKNVPRYGDVTESILERLAEYMKKHGFDDTIQLDVDDYICDAAATAGAYGYRKGFKDGVILLRTLMKL